MKRQNGQASKGNVDKKEREGESVGEKKRDPILDNDDLSYQDKIDALMPGVDNSRKFDVLNACYDARDEVIAYAVNKIQSEYLNLIVKVCAVGTKEERECFLQDLANEPDMLGELDDIEAQRLEMVSEMDKVPETGDAVEDDLAKIRLLFDKIYHEECLPCEGLLREILLKNPEPLASWLGVSAESLVSADRLRHDHFLYAFLIIKCSNGTMDCSPESEGAIESFLQDISVCGYDRLTGLQLQIGSVRMDWAVTLANFLLGVSGYPEIQYPPP